MGFADIFKDGLEGVSNVIGGVFGTDHPYPLDIAKNVSNFEVDEGDRAWQESRGYSFQVVKVDSAGSLSTISDWKEFVLQINPQEITQDEIFAIQVTPTFSGVLVEHQGVTLKDITISGTTGLSPNRRAGGSSPRTGRPILASGRSGYFEFHELRSYIRAYVEAKRNDKKNESGELRLIWSNHKDQEDLYVEPQKFTMKRNATKPFLYDYTIILKAIGIAGKINKTGSSLEILDSAVQAVQDTLDIANKFLEGSLGFLERVERDISNTVLAPIRSVIAFANTLKAAGGRLDAISAQHKVDRLFIKNLKEKVREIYDNSIDYLGKDVAIYNAAKGRIPTLRREEVDISWKEMIAIRALLMADKALAKALSSNSFFEVSFDSVKLNIEQYYNSAEANLQKSALLSSKLTLEKEKAAAQSKNDTVAVATINAQLLEIAKVAARAAGAGAERLKLTTATFKSKYLVGADHTIQTLAAAILGNADKYRDLIVLNDLVPPYIDPTGTNPNPRVLKPGDSLYVPQSSAPELVSGAARSVEYPISDPLTETEKNYGVDLMLDADYDLIINSSEDVKLVAGSQNVGQALFLKLYYELGSLKRHPEIGTNLTIGTKTRDLRKVISQVRTSLTTDSRVESILYSEFRQESNAVIINTVLKLAGRDQPINVGIPVRG